MTRESVCHTACVPFVCWEQLTPILRKGVLMFRPLTRLAGAAMALALACSASMVSAAEGNDLPEPRREFRAAWVATVANIDWPSEPGLTTEQQQAEAVAILDRAAEMNLNAIIFQVRPHCDALYASTIEPWSYYLTGEQGTPPDPYYDPLEFWIDGAHARGMELHAWFNPYRANHPATKTISDNHIVKKRPELARQLGDDGYYWLDPSLPEVREHSLAVVMDVVTRYDVDAIHFDDYFYPYPSYNNGDDFPDEDSWQAYLENGGNMSRGDWRRDGVNIFIQNLYTAIKEEKPHVKFGISPFGIWQPSHPRDIRGFNQHEVLYADARKWINEGWVDYFTPQLYWPIGQVPQSFPLLLGWWIENNTEGRNIWPGLFTSRYANPEDSRHNPDEIPNQILVARGMPGATGTVHFSMKMFLGESEIAQRLKDGLYSEPALVPPSPWLDDEGPEAPDVAAVANEAENAVRVRWTPEGREASFRWIVYAKRGDAWAMEGIMPAGTTETTLPLRGTMTMTEAANQGLDTREVEVEGDPVGTVAVVGVDRVGNMGEPRMVAVAMPLEAMEAP